MFVLRAQAGMASDATLSQADCPILALALACSGGQLISGAILAMSFGVLAARGPLEKILGPSPWGPLPKDFFDVSVLARTSYLLNSEGGNFSGVLTL